MDKFESIPKRLEEDYHTSKDDIPLVNVYTIRKVIVRGMLVTDDLLTDAIRDTQSYKDYVNKFERVEVTMIQPDLVESTLGTHRTPRATRTPNLANQQKPTSITPLPPCDDQERDDIIKATQLSLALNKTVKVYEEQQMVVVVKKKMLDEDVEKLVDEEEESDGIDFADTVILSDKDSGDRLEPMSHKKKPKKNDDDNKKKDDKKDNDDDDQDDHALIRTRVTGSSEIRTEKMQTLISSPHRSPRTYLSSPRTYLSSDKENDQELTASAKFDKSSASAGSCKNDAFRKRDHDEHQGDDAPLEGEKSVKRQKTSKSSKSTREPELTSKVFVQQRLILLEEWEYQGKEIKINLAAPTLNFSSIKACDPFSIIDKPTTGLIYLNNKNDKIFIDLEELSKFCDDTLEKVLNEVKMKIFKTKFLKKDPLLGILDLKIIKAYEREIMKRLKHRKQMRRWESFINGRPVLQTMKHQE
nr:hypothetical protein [Tanacetum cinerariifolium]